MAINSKRHVSYLLQKYKLYGYILYSTSPQKIDMPLIKRSQSTFGVFCKFYTFFLVPNKHRIQLLAMLNLALFKEPAL